MRNNGFSLAGLGRPIMAKSRSISAENFTGEKGGGGRAIEGTGAPMANAAGLGVGWKVSPSIWLPAHEEFVLADIEGEGTITHIWCTADPVLWRRLILEMYWDDAETPAVRVPLGDFFCNGWCERTLVNSLAIAVNPAGGFNCYFPMPFKKNAKIILKNLSDKDALFYYQVDYLLEELDDEIAYFHVQWNRSSPLASRQVHTLLDNVKGKGYYIGTYMAWQSNHTGWWGEGEFKFYLDGDEEFPTICGTGTEDYFGGAWNFDIGGTYQDYSTPYLGLPQIIRPDGLYRSQQRFGMYRWHINDPICFEEDITVTVQALGWREVQKEYLTLKDDIASTAYFYTNIPAAHSLQPEFTKDILDVI